MTLTPRMIANKLFFRSQNKLVRFSLTSRVKYLRVSSGALSDAPAILLNIRLGRKGFRRQTLSLILPSVSHEY